jgi:hypothetical protein
MKHTVSSVSYLRQTIFSLLSTWHTVKGQLLLLLCVEVNRMRPILGAFAGLLLNLKLIPT